MSKDGRIWLSHTGLETLERCPRCFWLQQLKGIRQPEGIVSRLANRFDSVLKRYFDRYRTKGKLPDLVKDKISGILENPFQEKYFVTLNDSYGFWGKLDECLINDKQEYVPVDFKTASSDPREKEILNAYRTQIDDYIFLLREKGKKPAGYGYLIYVYPDEGDDLHNGFPMIIHTVKLTGNPENTVRRIEKAISALEEPMPESNPECPFCLWYDRMKTQLGDKKAEVNIANPTVSPKPEPKKSPSPSQTSLIEI